MFSHSIPLPQPLSIRHVAMFFQRTTSATCPSPRHGSRYGLLGDRVITSHPNRGALGEGTGSTMSDDEADQVDSDANLLEGSLDGTDTFGFGPLIPTETERSLMERVRLELKHKLKQGYKENIVDIRDEILCKRRAGKLLGGTTSVLKSWWQWHSKWPNPTEEDKVRLV